MSAASRIVVSGVRSSCETSETKRCCTSDRSASSLIWDSMLSAIALNDRPSVASSSSPRTGRRTVSSPAASRALVSAASAIGVVTERRTNQAIPPIRMTSPIPTTHSVTWMNPRVCSALPRS